ncbi:MAG: efflux RND transporter permease subunit [Thermoflexibacter sp.]
MVKFLLFRPIAVLITTLSVVALGLLTFSQIPVSLLPEIAIPEITVQVSYPNTSARELHKAIVKPLKNQLLQVNHLADLQAKSRDGLAVIKLSFDYGTNINLAYIETNEKIDALMGSLPRDMPRPKVIKASASDIPVFNINVSYKSANQLSVGTQTAAEIAAEANSPSLLKRELGGEVNFLSLSEFCENVLKRRLEQLDEVALVDLSGLSLPEMVIIPNQGKLLSLGMNEQTLSQILQRNNIELGNLTVKDGQYQYNIRFNSVLRSKEDIENVYFKVGENRILQIKEVATVQLRPQKLRGFYTYNGKRAVVMSVIKQADAQLLQLRKTLQNLSKEFEKDYPQLEFHISQDQTELLDLSINNLISNLLVGGFCAFVVILFFLGDFKAPILIGITIPVSLIVTFLFFYLFGISVNVVSLAGLVLGIGMVVDSAIIVIENIEQFREKGYTLDDACIAGTNEVMMPLFTSILTNSAVFLPLVFISGVAGALFLDQALSVSLALGISLLSSFTLIPVLYRLFYRSSLSPLGKGVGKGAAPPSFFMRQVEKGYYWLMSFIFKRKAISIGFFVSLIFLAIFLSFSIPKQGMPNISRTELEAKIDWNEAITVEENEARISKINQELSNFEGKLLYTSAFIGQQQFLLNRELQQNFNETLLSMKVRDNQTFFDLQAKLQTIFKQDFPKANVSFSAAKNIFEQLFNTTQAPLVARFTNNQEAEVPTPARMENVYQNLSKKGLYTEFPSLQSRLQIEILKEKLLLYEVEYERVFTTLKTLFNENNLGNLKVEQRYIPIVLGGEEQEINTLLQKATIQNSKGQNIYLTHLIRVSTQQDYKSFFSASEGDFIPFNFDIDAEKITESQAVIQKIAQEDGNLSLTFSGSYFRNLAFIKELTVVILVAIGLLFFILAAQFESLLQPFIVMIAVVFGLTGSMLLLFVAGNSLNVMSAIGMVVLIGIVDNDSILKIDTMNKSRETHSLMESIKLAGKRRLKAQLMTSLTTILGLTPTLFSSGLGAELQIPLALSVIGGMLLGTLISVSFIPLMYWFMYRKKGV